MLFFRAMKEGSDGMPMLGPNARMLGVRPGGSPDPDVLARTALDFVFPGCGGLSVATGDPRNLPRHRRLPALGGTGRDPIWCVESEDLGPVFSIRLDRPGHALLEPAMPMILQDFDQALASTRTLWKVHSR
jgi:hypothetical protein